MSTAQSFRCRLITPDACILDEACVYASIPAWDGLFGVLPNRAPIVAKLGTGPLRLDFADSAKGQGGSRSFLVSDGFVQVAQNKMMILASTAVPVESINESDAASELASLEGRSAPADAPEQAARLAKARALAREKVRLAQQFKASGGRI